MYVNGKRIKPGKTLGEGGEAVVRLDESGRDVAYKLYKPGATDFITALRTRKIEQAALRSLPDNVYAPLAAITEKAKGGAVLGFQMRLFPPGYLNLEDLADKSVWVNFGLSQCDVMTIFRNLHDLLTQIHQAGVVIGDFSSMNVQFHPQTLHVLACDVDSWQFGDDLPCTIGTMDFLAPRQYNKDLESGQHPFKAEDDWWGYTINLFRSLTRVHPFREGKTGVPLTSDRVMQGLHVLNPDLKYPPTRIAQPLTSLPDRTLALFRDIFEARQVDTFPRAELDWLDTQWVDCGQHNGEVVVYAQERPECPHCAKDRTVPDLTQTPAVSGAVNIVPVYQAGQRVVFAKAVESQMFMLCVDAAQNLTAIWLDTAHNARTMTLPLKFAPAQQYDVNADSIMIAEGETVKLFNAADGTLAHQFQTMTYWHRPVVALGEQPLWLIGASLVRGELFYGQLHHKEMMQLSYGNVWFTADNSIVVGFTNLLGQQRWFVHVDGLYHELPQVSAGLDDYLLDWRVVFDGVGFAIIRRMQTKHESAYVVADLFDKAQHRHQERIPADTLYGMPALRNSLLYPTENGVLRISPGQGASIIPGTENVAQTSLLLAVKEGNVGHLHVIDETNSTVYRVTK